MAAQAVTGDQYRTIDRRMREIKRQVDQDGGYPFDLFRLEKLLQSAVEGDFPPDNRFDRYAGMLLPLEAQLDQLRKLDVTVWNDRVSKTGWFDNVNTTSDHVQRLDDLEFFYVEFGSPALDVELHWKAIAAHQRVPSDGGCYIDTRPDNLRLHSLAKVYVPGIYRVRINLAAHWEPQDGRTLIQVRERAQTTNQTLASAETLGAYGLHWELLREMDGENLPFVDLAGYEYKFPDVRGFAHCPYTPRGSGRFGLVAGSVRRVVHGWAAPVVLGVES